MTLVGHSTIQRDFHQWFPGVEHDGLGTIHTLPCNVIVRGLSEALFECTGEVARAQFHYSGQSADLEALTQVGFDVCGNTLCLPARQTALRLPVPPSALAIISAAERHNRALAVWADGWHLHDFTRRGIRGQ